MAPVAAQIKQDVLLLAGADDHFVPIDQLGSMRDSLTNPRSVTPSLSIARQAERGTVR